MIMRLTFFLLAYLFSLTVFSQENPEEVVFKFFHAMAEIDTSYLDKVMKDEMILSSTALVGEQYKITKGDKYRFITSIAKSKAGDLDEQISNLKVQRDGGLANVWIDYSFYYQGQFSHCGVNNFTLALEGKDWYIIALTDSRRKTNCHSHDAKETINIMLDNWHLGAANADSTAYFNLMTTNAIYVGTDKSEVWSKNEFLEFASPYFAKGKAWAFTKLERNIYSEDFKRVAWFDEVLDTWMGPCRGSGVVIKGEDGAWKVQHYVLSVAVDNNDIKEYIKIIEQSNK